MPKTTTLDALYYLAESRDGYFTTRQACKLGITRTAVAKAEQRGRLERVSRGVYRLTHFPPTPTARYWEAILWPQAREEVSAVLSGATALRLHELCSGHTSAVHITLPANFHLRRTPPPWLSVHCADLASEDIAVVNGLPVTTITKTLRDVGESGDADLLAEALRNAKERALASGGLMGLSGTVMGKKASGHESRKRNVEQ